jgi:hypothetical protein
LEALEEHWNSLSSGDQESGALRVIKSGEGGAALLKAQMQADGLRPLDAGAVVDEEDDEGPLRMGTSTDSDGKDHDEAVAVWPEETLVQAGDYLRLSVSCTLRFTSSASDLDTNGPRRQRLITTSTLLDDCWRYPGLPCSSSTELLSP